MADLRCYKDNELDKIRRGARHGVPDQVRACYRRPWQQNGRLAFDRDLRLYLVHHKTDGRWKAVPLSDDQQQDAADHGAPVELLLAELNPKQQILPPLLSPGESSPRTSSGSSEGPPDAAEQRPFETPGDEAILEPTSAVAALDPLNPKTWPLEMRRRLQPALNEQDPWKHHPYLLRQQRRRFPGGQVVLVRSRANSIREERAGCREVTLLQQHGTFLTTVDAWAELKRQRRKEPEHYGREVFTALVADEWDLEQVPGEPELRMHSLSRWFETAPGITMWRKQPVGRNVNQRQIWRNRVAAKLGHLAAHYREAAWETPMFEELYRRFLKLCPPETQRLSHKLGREGNAIDHLQSLLESISKAVPHVRVILAASGGRPPAILEAEGSWLLEQVEGDFNSGPRIARLKASEAWDGNDGWRLVRLVREPNSIDRPSPMPMLVEGV